MRDLASGSTSHPTHSGLLRTFYRAVCVRSVTDLSPDESASTLFRFFRSKHVTELRLIFWLGVIVAAISLFCLLMCLAGSAEGPLRTISTYAGPLLTAAGVIVAWAYRSASTRLGVVDLFACEISTICRVATILDAGKRFVELYEDLLQANGAAPPAVTAGEAAIARSAYAFVAEEQYFPVFDSNARDLQLLEAHVVNNIVEFYTYMKAARDCMRKLAALPDLVAGREARRQAILSVVYMLYLANESARLSVRDLVEFEPAEAERTVTILVTELKCYALLVCCFEPEDHRYKRLRLRLEDYQKEVYRLHEKVDAHADHRDWEKARRTLQELDERFLEVQLVAQGAAGGGGDPVV